MQSGLVDVVVVEEASRKERGSGIKREDDDVEMSISMLHANRASIVETCS